MRSFSEKDWKLYRDRIADWQETYMDRLNREYIELLNGSDAPSDKFWALDKRIKKDRDRAGVRVQMSRSDMVYQIAELYHDGAITMEDLADFSDDLREAVKLITRT